MSTKDTVVITAGNKGIGKATAVAFAKKGYNVVISSRELSNASDAVKEVEAVGGDILVVKADVTKEEDIQNLMSEAVKKYGKIDVLVNNAGTAGDSGSSAPLDEITNESFDDIFNINLKGVFWSMKYAIKGMLKTGGGSIVNNSSVFGQIGRARRAHYVASKHAVNGLTKAAALDYATKGIRVNAVSPGPIETEALRAHVKANSISDEHISAFVPMHKIGAPEDIANGIVYLASKENSFLTGSILVIDGGVTVQ